MMEEELIDERAVEGGYGFQTRKQAQQALAYCRADSRRRKVAGIRYRIERHDLRSMDPRREWGIFMIQHHAGEQHKTCRFVWFECCLRRDMKLRPA